MFGHRNQKIKDPAKDLRPHLSRHPDSWLMMKVILNEAPSWVFANNFLIISARGFDCNNW